jgi:MtN3 and saliva related transmembrane protein
MTPAMLSPALIEWIGGLAAVLTTLSYFPQALKTISTGQTRDISLWAQVLLFMGIIMWLVYGVYIASWPLIGSNIVTFFVVGTILTMKIRHG